MKNELLKVSIRKNSIYIPKDWVMESVLENFNESTMSLVANCSKLGYVFSEELLQKINSVAPTAKLKILQVLKEVTGVEKNWTPLVKQWDIPTGETIVDHLITAFSNLFKLNNGTSLPCGHVIPKNTFPLDRYNGCPFCGKPFKFDELDYDVDYTKLKTLELCTSEDLKEDLNKLLASPVALDATQLDSLKILISAFGYDQTIEVKMKESLMVVIDSLVEMKKVDEAGKLFESPNDILRYLWYKHTGFIQILQPKTIIKINKRNAKRINHPSTIENQAGDKAKDLLKLKFNRSESKIYAKWINDLEMNVEKQCEIMHSKRGMWVRVIRALRLAEYSKRKEFGKLKTLMDVFYNEKYEVWAAKVNRNKLKLDYIQTFKLLKERPGLFARSLFSTMLWFGPELTIKNFKEIMHKIPPRLIFTLNMYADVYFDKTGKRTVKTLSGISKKIPANKLLQLFSVHDLNKMKKLVQGLTLDLIKSNFESQINDNKSIYIDKGLYNIPISIGDRSDTIQDTSCALMGTKFPVEGDKIRLFLQWGMGLPSQHLDMDLSCRVSYEDRVETCSYSRLTIPGCKHSGDIQRIPPMVGTAEYIEIDLNELKREGAKYVSFTCNAFTSGGLVPNLVVGWMNSLFPMKINASGVAYNPTALQHQVKIKESTTKGILFGVLDVEAREIVWIEMGFGGQLSQNLDMTAVTTLLAKLDAKLKIGDLLVLKAESQDLEIVNDPSEADEIYDMKWAMNTAQVSALFLEKASSKALAQ